MADEISQQTTHKMKSKKPKEIGFLASGQGKSTMSTFKERSNDAQKIGVRLCFIEMTNSNLEAILSKKKIKVRVWKNNSHLETLETEVPQIIYDRTLIGKTESLHDLIVEALVGVGCIFVNSPEVRMMARDKWAQYRFFVVRGIKTPLTRKYHSSEISFFLRKSGTIFIKPRSGSEGKNQIIIKTLGDKKFQVTSTFGKKKSVIVDNQKQLRLFLEKFDLRNYIIQSGVNIDKIEEKTRLGFRTRSYDFRVIVQKTSRGKPVVTILFVRVGPRSSEQANISQGGHPQDIEFVFENHLEIGKELGQVAKNAFQMLSQKYQVSEMAFDFVLDKEGDFWFLEMNSRPGTKGPRTLREWVPSDKIYIRKGVIPFDEEYSNAHRLKWGARFLAFRVLPFYYGKTLSK